MPEFNGHKNEYVFNKPVIISDYSFLYQKLSDYRLIVNLIKTEASISRKKL